VSKKFGWGSGIVFLPENPKAKGRNGERDQAVWESHSQLNVDMINKNTYCLEILTVLWSWIFQHFVNRWPTTPD